MDRPPTHVNVRTIRQACPLYRINMDHLHNNDGTLVLDMIISKPFKTLNILYKVYSKFYLDYQMHWSTLCHPRLFWLTPKTRKMWKYIFFWVWIAHQNQSKGIICFVNRVVIYVYALSKMCWTARIWSWDHLHLPAIKPVQKVPP